MSTATWIRLFVVNFFDDTIEVGERTIDDTNGSLPGSNRVFGLGLSPLSVTRRRIASASRSVIGAG